MRPCRRLRQRRGMFPVGSLRAAHSLKQRLPFRFVSVALAHTSHVEAAIQRIDRGRGRVVAAGVAVVAAVLAVLAVMLVSMRAPSGPLAERHSDDEGFNTTGGRVRRSQFFTATLVTVRLRGSDAAILESVDPLHSEQAAGLTLRYATLVRGVPGSDRGWPPRGVLRPVKGTIVEPGRHALIWVGGSAATVGSWSIRGFSLRYHVGSRHYTSTIHQGIDVDVARHCPSCTPTRPRP